MRATVGMRVDALARNGLRQPCLADAAGADHGDQPVLVEQTLEQLDFALPANQRFGRFQQAVLVRAGCGAGAGAAATAAASGATASL